MAIWKSRHRHLGIIIVIGISIGIGIEINLFNIYIFLVFSFGISTTQLQILISLQFPIHPTKGVQWCCRKRLFELFEASVHLYFEKLTAQKVSAYLPATHPGWSSFQVHSQAFPRLFRKVLQSSYSVENLLAPASVKRNSTAHVFSGIFQNFKNMQGKAGDCNLKACNLLKRNSLTELFQEIF